MTSTDLTMLQLASFEPGRRIAADFIADSIREAIQSGALADGAVLKQAAIADHFDISRVPVREAMRQLLAEGLIELRAHHIAVVSGLPIERISEIYDNRALIEGYLLERAVPNIPVGVVKQLRATEKTMRSEYDHQEWLRLNGEFHRTMNQYARDVTALELIDQLKSRAERYVRMWGTGGGLHRPEEAGADHVQILDLVGAGDAKGARTAVEHHIRTTGERLVAYGRSQQHKS